MRTSFSEDGYALISNVLHPSECDALLASLAAPVAHRARAGERHLLSNPLVRAIANDPRLIALAKGIPFRATLFDKSRNANWSVVWHQDTALPLRARTEREGWGPWSRKDGVDYAHAPAEALRRVTALRIHLDDSTADNGPLRVIPGSHALGVLTDDDVESIAHQRESVDCVTPRGGIVCMRPLIIHSSTRLASPQPRRVLHLEYAESLEIVPGMTLAVA